VSQHSPWQLLPWRFTPTVVEDQALVDERATQLQQVTGQSLELEYLDLRRMCVSRESQGKASSILLQVGKHIKPKRDWCSPSRLCILLPAILSRLTSQTQRTAVFHRAAEVVRFSRMKPHHIDCGLYTVVFD
jgi:hypothetical protein